MSNSPRTQDAQVQYKTAPSNSVVDFRSREQWHAAFRAVALARKYTKTEILLAGALAQNFHCKRVRCDPGYDVLAAQLNAGLRTVKLAAKTLETDGWCSRKRGGRDENVNFTLTVPSGISADIAAPMEDVPDNLISAAMPAPMDDTPYVQDSTSISANSAAPHNTEVDTEKSAAPPRAPRSVETQYAWSARTYAGRQISHTPSNPPDQAYADLWSAYPEYPLDCSDIDCRQLFDQLLDEGVDPDILIEAAAAYAAQCKNTKPKLMIYWLRVRCWEENLPPAAKLPLHAPLL